MFDKFQLADFYMAGPSQDLNIIHKNDLTYEFITIFCTKNKSGKIKQWE